MKQISFTTNFTVFDSLDELNSEDRDLMKQALQFRKQAYAPYSKFQVGVALLLDNGKVIKGNSFEWNSTVTFSTNNTKLIKF